jgi:hypothetical protein
VLTVELTLTVCVHACGGCCAGSSLTCRLTWQRERPILQTFILPYGPLHVHSMHHSICPRF